MQQVYDKAACLGSSAGAHRNRLQLGTRTWHRKRYLGLRGIIRLLQNFIQLWNSDLIALNKFKKNVVVDSQINNLNAPLSNFVSRT